jgi:PAS domain S-box-containing protein
MEDKPGPGDFSSRRSDADQDVGQLPDYFRSLVEALPSAIYATDAEGRITFYNEAAAQLWGRRPRLGEDWWCGSWRLYWPDGTRMQHDECPMAQTLRTGKPVRGVEAVAERPDGTRFPFIPFPTPLFDRPGRLTGAVNVLMDISDQKAGEAASQWLAAIVASADDAIVTKNLDAVIQSWNGAAERMFGYSAKEVIGKPIFIIIPENLRSEEAEILSRIRRGERIEHFETVRVHKDGTLLDVSLTISPVRDKTGKIVGASKIARDIRDRKRSDAVREMLLGEIKHRSRNTLGVVQAMARQTLRFAPPSEKEAFIARLHALSEAHDLLTERDWQSAGIRETIQSALRPFGDGRIERVALTGPPFELKSDRALLLSMLIHELATNAVKYGALSNSSGRVDLQWRPENDEHKLAIEWIESGGPPVDKPQEQGFGTRLIERALAAEGGTSVLEFPPGGLRCLLTFVLSTK